MLCVDNVFTTFLSTFYCSSLVLLLFPRPKGRVLIATPSRFFLIEVLHSLMRMRECSGDVELQEL